uniref:Uncharacterized protein n=1 Tax=Emiliania huxleyi TaxID=2903 RepID=A0A6V2VQN1_EMIHU
MEDLDEACPAPPSQAEEAAAAAAAGGLDAGPFPTALAELLQDFAADARAAGVALLATAAARQQLHPALTTGGLFEAEVNLAPMPPAGRHAAPLLLLPVARH